jgi:hypothetical protein
MNHKSIKVKRKIQEYTFFLADIESACFISY